MDKVKKKDILIKKARKKYISHGLASLLIKENPNSPLLQSYANSVYCSAVLQDIDGEGLQSSGYCKNRWCPLCQSIRTATLINHYAGQLEELPDLYMVTLTAPTVTAAGLPKQQKRFSESWRKILRDDSRYSGGLKLSGIRKTECTTRPAGRYHYHYHVVLNGKHEGLFLLTRWLYRMLADQPKYSLQLFDRNEARRHTRKYTETLALIREVYGTRISTVKHEYTPAGKPFVRVSLHGAGRSAMDTAVGILSLWLTELTEGAILGLHITKADNTAVMELFKYFTKLTVKAGDKERAFIPAKRLDTIFRVMRGSRVYQPFGGVKPAKNDFDIERDPRIRKPGVWMWDATDWWNVDTGEMLSGYLPDSGLMRELHDEAETERERVPVEV